MKCQSKGQWSIEKSVDVEMSSTFQKNGNLDQKLVSYEDALSRIREVAYAQAVPHDGNNPLLPVHKGRYGHAFSGKDTLRTSRTALVDALNRRAAATVSAPHATPQFDTSAMDGYAVCAANTTEASEDNPLMLRVVDSIAAGDSQIHKNPSINIQVQPQNCCVEIMTGARFPEQAFPHLDSVVKVEDVVTGECWSDSESAVLRYIQLIRPVKLHQNRRPAGSDFTKGEVVLEYGELIRPKHVAALTSLSFVDIEVLNQPCEGSQKQLGMRKTFKPKIGVLSTGSEIVDPACQTPLQACRGVDKQNIPDSNGPYLVSGLRDTCPWAEVEHLGIVEDDEDALTTKLARAIASGDLDIMITSGGVSRGRHDLVRHVIETRLGGRVRFHGVRIRPGAPVLFATFDRKGANGANCGGRQLAFFGAPGNPLAAAATLRFFVLPYVHELLSQRQSENPSGVSLLHEVNMSTSSQAIVTCGKVEQHPESMSIRRKPRDMTVFWLGKRRSEDAKVVEILDDQASYKLRSMLKAHCWVIVPAGQSEVICGDKLISRPL